MSKNMSARGGSASGGKNKSSAVKTLAGKIEKALEKIRPTLQADGGDVKFVEFDEKTGVVKVQLVGMCAHCPMSQITLKQGIEEEVKKEISEVRKVVAV